MSNYTTKWLLAGLVCVLAGCNCMSPEARHDEFVPMDSSCSVHKYLVSQSASGAREESTLLPSHFDGTKLNDLGSQQLDMMVACSHGGAMTLYLDLPYDSTMQDRRAAVEQFLKDAGVSAESVQIKTGSNPNLGAPAAWTLARLAKIEAASTPGVGYGTDENSSGTATGTAPSNP